MNKMIKPVLQQPIAHVLDLGRLSNHTWSQKGRAGNSSIDTASLMKTLNSYYVATNPNAKTRCIDGRHDPEFDETKLGAQIPGGAPGAALAYRLGIDEEDLTRGTFYSDAEMMIDSYLRLGLSPGGHRDDSSEGEAMGCGAIDKMDAILVNMTDPSLVEDHTRLVKALLDGAFDRDDYLRVLGAGLVLCSRSHDYLAGRGETLNLLEQKAPHSVAVLNGPHQEALVVVNLVPGTTLTSNRFADDHHGVQAFGYDLWCSKQLAEMLFPLPSQMVDRHRFVMAQVIITIATLMTLTDGSQRLFVRAPTV